MELDSPITLAPFSFFCSFYLSFGTYSWFTYAYYPKNPNIPKILPFFLASLEKDTLLARNMNCPKCLQRNSKVSSKNDLESPIQPVEVCSPRNEGDFFLSSLHWMNTNHPPGIWTVKNNTKEIPKFPPKNDLESPVQLAEVCNPRNLFYPRFIGWTLISHQEYELSKIIPKKIQSFPQRMI